MRKHKSSLAGKVHRIGFLSERQPPNTYFEAVQQGLRERG
jgi:hypothetical protein